MPQNLIKSTQSIGKNSLRPKSKKSFVKQSLSQKITAVANSAFFLKTKTLIGLIVLICFGGASIIIFSSAVMTRAAYCFNPPYTPPAECLTPFVGISPFSVSRLFSAPSTFSWNPKYIPSLATTVNPFAWKSEFVPQSDVVCSDTDGGVTYNVAGRATLKRGALLLKSAMDICSSTSRYMSEYSCVNSSVPGRAPDIIKEDYYCRDYCYRGACIPKCYDSDGGGSNQKYTRGSVTEYGGGSTPPVQVTDYCNGPIFPNTLVEVYCSSGSVTKSEYKCKDYECHQHPTTTKCMCLNGACVYDPSDFVRLE